MRSCHLVLMNKRKCDDDDDDCLDKLVVELKILNWVDLIRIRGIKNAVDTKALMRFDF